MHTRAVHRVDDSTVCALSTAKCGVSLRILADKLGLPRNTIGTLSDVLRKRPGAMTLASENDLRKRLGLAPLPEPYMIALCPSCSGVHIAGDCHGRPVAAVVTLAPGEVVVDRRPADQPQPAKRRPDDRATLHVPKDLARRINALRGKLTQAEYLYMLMDSIEETAP